MTKLVADPFCDATGTTKALSISASPSNTDIGNAPFAALDALDAVSYTTRSIRPGISALNDFPILCPPVLSNLQLGLVGNTAPYIPYHTTRSLSLYTFPYGPEPPSRKYAGSCK